jgi:hypothetical protein
MTPRREKRIRQGWRTPGLCHVWTAPFDQGDFFSVARIVGAVMSSAFWCAF